MIVGLVKLNRAAAAATKAAARLRFLDCPGRGTGCVDTRLVGGSRARYTKRFQNRAGAPGFRSPRSG